MNASKESTLVIVGGAPASGKSTLSRQLSRDLRIPVFSKDDFKESLFDAIEYRDREWSKRLGKASFELLVMCARKLVSSGGSCIVESTFRPGDGLYFEDIRRSHSNRVLQVFCRASVDEICERFHRRMNEGSRHPGHCDESNDEELIHLMNSGEFVPLEVDGLLIQINTGADCRQEFRTSYQDILSNFT